MSVYRPTSVMVLGWLGVLVGGSGVLCAPFSVIRALDARMPAASLAFFTLAGMGLAVLQCYASLGLLQLRSWSPRLLNIWAGLSVLLGLAAVAEGGDRVLQGRGYSPEAASTATIVSILVVLFFPAVTMLVVNSDDVQTACMD